MGIGRSKSLPISYEEACRRVPTPVLQRFQETFKRLSSANGYLPQTTFIRDVMGETVPAKLSEAIYQSFGGGQKGIGFKDLMCGLVLLVYGTKEEKARFVSLLVSEDEDKVTRERLDTLIIACDGKPTSVNLDSLFNKHKSAAVSMFEQWVLDHPDLASFTVWLLGDRANCGFSLEGNPDPPSFHQTLAKIYSIEKEAVMDIEKSYWSLKGGGKFDLPLLQSYISPHLPEDLCKELFRVMDLNLDGHIDLSELIQMVAKCCYGDVNDPHSFCFSIFDRDGDGFLSREELTDTVTHLLDISEENRSVDDSTVVEPVSTKELVDKILRDHGKEKSKYLSESEYLEWAKVSDLCNCLIKVLVEIGHVRFGLRPSDPILEGQVVNGYLNRFHKAGCNHGDIVYIMPYEWFQKWKIYTSQEGATENISLKRPKKSKRHKGKRSKHQHFSPDKITPIPAPIASNVVGNIELREDTVTIELEQMTPKQNISATQPANDLSPLRPPPIDNLILCVPEPSGSKKLPSLTNEGGRLISSKVIMEDKDYVFLPEVVWKVFVLWYGTSGYSPLSLPREVNPSGHVELYPLVFMLYRHTTNPPPVKANNMPWPIASLLTSLGFGSTGTPPPVSGPLVAGGGGDETNPTQPPTPRRVPCYQAAFTKTTTLREVCEKIQQMLRVKAEDLRLYDLTDESQPILLENEEATLTELNLSDGQKLLLETRNKDNSWPEEIMSILKEVIVNDEEKPCPTDIRVPPGATGLSNLGNTCFMNSALQCVSCVQPLTMYFREKDHLLEINKDNPLGMGGVMAKRYGELIEGLWTGNAKSVTPLKFRFTVGRLAPRFNAFQQQDSQELLAFVLDGLHEDLNRVKDKGYRELNDSDGRDDAVVAKEAWDYHLSRNQSVVVDLFQGQLKSVVTCKVCQYQSVRFDPFTFLSLPLPMDSTINLEVIVVCLDGSQPMRYGLKLELDDKYRQLKRSLSDLCTIDSTNMLLVEVYGGMVRNIPSDSTKIRSVLGGWLYAYELPPPTPVAPTSRADSPDEVRRQIKAEEIVRERAQSIHTLDEEKKRAETARASLDCNGSHDMLCKSRDMGSKSHDMTHSMQSAKSQSPVDESLSVSNGSRDLLNKSHDSLDKSHDEEELVVEAIECLPNDSSTHRVSPSPHSTVSDDGLEGCDGFVFAVHRRNFTVEQYFVSCQKDRPVIFGTPVVVPCVAKTPRRDLYSSVWLQVQRLIIPDPPDKTSSPDHGNHYPFVLKLVAKNGFSCSRCPWYSFCHGCVLDCDDEMLGRTSGYIAIDWETTALHLKYQSAQERPLEHESMESLKVIDMEPINLYECFKAFVHEDELGDEESWYCKQCKEHREAVKSLEIWRLPPILIIHLKRFQFFNGRWVKSQRSVSFPLTDLDPLRHTAKNSNVATPILTVTSSGEHEPCPIGESCDVDQMSCDDESKEYPMESFDHLEDESMEEMQIGGEDPDRKSSNEADPAVKVSKEEPINKLSHEASSNLYNLFAICCHSGMMGGGHYVSFARNPNGKWYYFNDSSCKETTESRVNEESPYMLFYELNGLDKQYNRFRAKRSGVKGQDIGCTEDDQAFEENLKNWRKACSIQ